MSTTNKKCYFPNGNEILAQENVTPCDPSPTTGHSACCPTGAVCLTNGLCFQQNAWGNRVARSGCTDESWLDSACSGICEDVFPSVPISIYLIEPDSTDGNFCCGGMWNGSSCPTETKGSNEPFTMERGLVLFPNTSLTLNQYALSLLGTESEGNTSVSSSPSDSNATTPAVEDGTTETGGAAKQCAVAKNDTRNTTPVALGVALGVCLLILSGLLAWQWRRARKLQQELRNLKASTNSGSLVDKIATEWDGQGHGTMGWTATGGWSPIPSTGDIRSEIGDDQRGRVKELPGLDRRGELQG